ncbi:MAG: hypothetical protein C6H99_00400, partial [Epsilonproteobacteria bacterium]|nr:hypothetical protein [Campylobacterota bacterium]NPA63818.1 response regulator [Campylobacterota bacterium]
NYTKSQTLCSEYLKYHTHKPIMEEEPLFIDRKVAFNAKALVAEDNIINQKLIKKTLEDYGIDVDLAENGEVAVQKYKEGKYDIVFMDIQMPKKDGVEAMQEIVAYEKEQGLPHTPIVALTAHALKGDRERFLSKGFDEYLTKPLNRADIESVLKTYLSSKAAHQAQKAAHTPASAIKEKDMLLFDKNPLELKLFNTVLQSRGYNVTAVKDLESFKDKLRQERYKVILIDKDSLEQNSDLIKELTQQQPAKLVLLGKREDIAQDLLSMVDMVLPKQLHDNSFFEQLKSLMSEEKAV